MATQSTLFISLAAFLLIASSLCSLRSLSEATQETPNCSAFGCASCTEEGQCQICVNSYNKDGVCTTTEPNSDTTHDKNCSMWNKEGECAICAEGYSNAIFARPSNCKKLENPIPRCLNSVSMQDMHLCMSCRDGYPVDTLDMCGPVS